MPEHVSPEEKLLKLIRHKDRQSAPPKENRDFSAKAQKGSFSAGRVLDVLGKMIILGIVGLSGYVGYELFLAQKPVLLTAEDAGAPEAKEPQTGILTEDVKPYSYYTDVIKTRDIFESPVYGNMPKKQQETPKISSLPELTQNLKLVGIILDRDPLAIIENTQEQRTFFLRKGEAINNATVESIEEGRVTLLYGGQMVELTP